MNEFTSLPESISHKQLDSLLSKAPKELFESHLDINISNQEKEQFERLLEDWSLISEKLINELRKKSDYIVQKRCSKSLMALGALEAHLNMAFQAQKASDVD